MPVIGLTGGVASGKTLVTDYLERKGIAVIDADRIAREVVRAGGPAYREVIEAFGPGILDQDGALNRKKLGALVFDSPSSRKRLEAIIHPRVYETAWKEIRRIQALDPSALIVFSVPLLFETGHDKDVDKTVLVYADEPTQVRRLMQRNGLTEPEAMKRVSAQMSIDAKSKIADYIIRNMGTVEETFRQVDAILSELRS